MTVHSRGPTAADWLDAWESALPLAPGWREAALLKPACPGTPLEELAALPLGERDRLLLELHEALFGQQLPCTALCPACGERCEWEQPLHAWRSAHEPAASREAEWRGDSWHIRLRPPTGLDLAAAAATAEPERALFERCLIRAQHGDARVAASAVPPELLPELADALAAANPQLDMSVALACPACGHAWEADFDIGPYLWAELDAWAQRLLLDVHRLAQHYGWSEPEVLALSAQRRARYLAMVGT